MKSTQSLILFRQTAIYDFLICKQKNKSYLHFHTYPPIHKTKYFDTKNIYTVNQKVKINCDRRLGFIQIIQEKIRIFKQRLNMLFFGLSSSFKGHRLKLIFILVVNCKLVSITNVLILPKFQRNLEGILLNNTSYITATQLILLLLLLLAITHKGGD